MVGFCEAVTVTGQQRPTGLLDDGRLAASAVVANCAMNRERQLAGVNSYTRELGFNPVDALTAVLGEQRQADATVAWPPTGRLVADLDLTSIRLPDRRPAGRRLADRLRAAGFRYDTRRRRIGCTGPLEVNLPYTFLGADDHAGANYTGQPAVHSYYQEDQH